jgi:hypothetical protein
MTLAAGQGADGGEANGTPGYKAKLPIASGEIVAAQGMPAQAVPEPGDIGIMGLGLVMLSGLFMIRKARKARSTFRANN